MPKKRNIRQILLVFIVLLMASSAVRAGNLILDGSFENAPFGPTFNGSIGDGAWNATSFQNSGGGALSGVITAGTAITGNVYYGHSLAADPLTSGFTQPGGSHVILFQGDTESDTLSQVISLTAGTTYEVGFDITPAIQGVHNPGIASFTANIGGSQFFSTTTGALASPTSDTDNSTWVHIAYDFTAVNTGSENLTFAFDTNFNTSQDILIDRVYVTPSTIPEPTSLDMCGVAGITCLGISRMRPSTAVRRV
jgi:hypothetical protein